MKEFEANNENDYLPLRDVVFNTLRTSILTGELKPGERLTEVSCLWASSAWRNGKWRSISAPAAASWSWRGSLR